MPEAESGGETKVSSLLKINIVEQIEYYFGDFNMMKDKFLRAEVQKNDGWIPIKTLLLFNRLASLSKEPDVILSAFKDHTSDIVEINTENKSIRRNPNRVIPEPGEHWRSVVSERTVYAKGFPVETTTLDDILKFMQTFGKIDNVFKRSYFDKALKEWKFKGSAFIAFPTKEDAQKFLDIKSVKYAGNELIRKWQVDYNEEKKNERIQNKLKAKEAKEKLVKDQVESELKTDQKLPTGALVQLIGLKGDITVNGLKKKLTEDFKWDVGFVDYSVGELNAYVRLQEANSAKEALAKLTDNSFQIGDVTIKAELVEGEKEVELLQKMEADRNSRVLQNFMKSKNKGGKRNKGGYRGKGRRGGRNDDDRMDEHDGNAAKKDSKTPAPSTGDAVNGSSSDPSSLKRKPEEGSGDSAEVSKKSKTDE